MKNLAIAVTLALVLLPGHAADLNPADALFQAGKFADAEKAYAQTAANDPANLASQLQQGSIALLANHLDQAQLRLKKALALQPANVAAKIMLAEVFYRRDQFAEAANAMAGLGPNDSQELANVSTLNRAKLESFKGLAPYELHGPGDVTRLKFVKRDPLPLVKVRINGGKEVLFFIDTGGAELALDTAFAKELGIPQFGAVQGTFSGGQHAAVLNGRVDSVTVGDWVVKNVPVQELALRQLSQAFGIQQLDGCVGTIFLSHFLSTIDFRNGELVLRRKTAAQNLNHGSKQTDVPFWMAGDHFMVGWGQVNSLPPALLLSTPAWPGREQSSPPPYSTRRN
jgi:tetratricopeptide (TPR) repeat protein